MEDFISVIKIIAIVIYFGLLIFSNPCVSENDDYIL